MEQVDCIIIGAGVVGLAIARELSMQGKEVFVLDKESSFGQETSSRNSEVIHAGIYYPKDSLKAKLCVRGRDMLYEYCAKRHIAHKKCGKLIVACSDKEIEKLNEIKLKAKNNGVHDLVFLSKEQVLEKEPDLSAVAGLYSPSTGIVDSHSFMLSLLADIENHGGSFVANTKVISGKIIDDGFILKIKDNDDEYEIKTKMLFNSAGLYAADLLKNIDGFPIDKIPKIYYAKGSYFSLSAKHNFKHLVYPVPEVGGLGIHLTLDMQGQAKFGPNVEWVDSINYDVDENLRGVFYQNIKKYYPSIKEDNLLAGYSGVRPKTAPKGTENNFFIQTEDEHGIKNMINLFGIESPGLTASLAISELLINYISK